MHDILGICFLGYQQRLHEVWEFLSVSLSLYEYFVFESRELAGHGAMSGTNFKKNQKSKTL